eukprot:TRINITY_DN127_c0_g1_i1.p1 TRINITY_DN127_c0_g1~~TRINITY_DN127_c0_g1_i1.p1  ORF type:complete len:234 (-),score=58.87 TRINITY_DN127_c0_g1_i1:71-772(-)
MSAQQGQSQPAATTTAAQPAAKTQAAQGAKGQRPAKAQGGAPRQGGAAKTVKPAGVRPAGKPQQAKPAAQGQSAAAAAGAPLKKKTKRKKKVVIKSVQTFGKKKSAIAVAYTCEGVGLLKVNGSPIELVEPQVLRYKVLEPILLLGRERFAKIDIRIQVQGGGHVSQIYAIRQALAKAVVAYYQKYVDESEKQKIKDILMDYDRSLLAIDARRCEPKKFGGRGARARFQKSYR